MPRPTAYEADAINPNPWLRSKFIEQSPELAKRINVDDLFLACIRGLFSSSTWEEIGHPSNSAIRKATKFLTAYECNSSRPGSIRRLITIFVKSENFSAAEFVDKEMFLDVKQSLERERYGDVYGFSYTPAALAAPVTLAAPKLVFDNLIEDIAKVEPVKILNDNPRFVDDSFIGAVRVSHKVLNPSKLSPDEAMKSHMRETGASIDAVRCGFMCSEESVEKAKKKGKSEYEHAKSFAELLMNSEKVSISFKINLEEKQAGYLEFMELVCRQNTINFFNKTHLKKFPEGSKTTQIHQTFQMDRGEKDLISDSHRHLLTALLMFVGATKGRLLLLMSVIRHPNHDTTETGIPCYFVLANKETDMTTLQFREKILPKQIEQQLCDRMKATERLTVTQDAALTGKFYWETGASSGASSASVTNVGKQFDTLVIMD